MSPDAAKILQGLGYDPEHARRIAGVLATSFHTPPPAMPTASDARYLDVLHRLAGKVRPRRDAVQIIGRDLDTVAKPPFEITFLKGLTLAALACEPSGDDVLLIATARNEGPFLIEWIAHHRACGFRDILVFTNDNTDGSNELLLALARHDIIRLVFNEAGDDINPQIKAYEHALLLQPDLRRFGWWMTLDIDEFLVLDARYDHSIPRFVTSLHDNPGQPDCVCFNWLWAGSHGAVRRVTRNVTERFGFGGAMVPFVKSLFRPAKALSLRGVHKPVLTADAVIVNSALSPAPREGHDVPFAYDGGRINHYWNKSFEEFLVKQARGRDRDVWRRETDLFFDWDVPPQLEVPASLPEALAQRVRSEQVALLALPDMQSAQHDVEHRYRRIAEDLCASVSIETLFQRALWRSRLIRKLQRPPSSDASLDPADVRRLLRDRRRDQGETRR